MMMIRLLNFFFAISSIEGWTAEWINMKSAPKIVPPRSGHVSFVDRNNDVYVFGGYAEEEHKEEKKDDNDDQIYNRYPTNDLWKFSTTNKGWTKVLDPDLDDFSAATGTYVFQPQQRIAAAAAYLPSSESTYVFGGWDPQTPGTGGVILKDIVEYDSKKQKWIVHGNDLWEPTSRLVAINIDESNILLHNHRCIDSVLLFNGYTLMDQPTSGNSPSPRGLHVAAICGSRLVVFGGAAQDGTMSNEVFCLNLNTWEWNGPLKVDDDGDKKCQPSPRASPCFCSLGENKFVLFGGASRLDDGSDGLHGCNDVWLLSIEDNDTASWELLMEDSSSSSSTTDSKIEQPPGRNAASMIELKSLPYDFDDKDNDGGSSSSSKYFLLSGGWDPFKTTYNDNYVLKMKR